ncbi:MULTISPECIES: LemA family protein [unclassified Oleiphilus]|uniref:LemA family protein n=2 Tax=Oleiphilus TaxID=141450 RepID=UPI000A90A4A0|nr:MULTISPECIES: LemA family protein [unclassified Oleiphilus]
MDISSLVTAFIIIFAIFYIIRIFNTLVALKNRYQNSFSQIEVQLKRRYDLIPNLVETAKAYLTHERETLEAVISARNQALAGLKAASANPSSAGALQELAKSEGLLQSALGSLNVAVEAYPELKASDNMSQLSEELTSTENRVSFARQSFNDSVTEYNQYRQSFPQNLFATSFGHREDATLLEFEDSAQIQSAPKVSF